MSTLAERQLWAWQKIAEDWPSLEHHAEKDSKVVVARCQCGKGVLLVTDSAGRLFSYTRDQWLALLVAHLRNHHQELDPEWPD